MKAYNDILRNCLENGTWSDNRTGIPTLRIPWGATFEHNMANGFPLLTTKKVAYQSIFTELEFFIKGLTDKQWLKDRGCKIWNEWANADAWQPLYEQRLPQFQQSFNMLDWTASATYEEQLNFLKQMFSKLDWSDEVPKDTKYLLTNQDKKEKPKKGEIPEVLKTIVRNKCMNDSTDLGPVYGWQWRHWNGEYRWNPEKPEINYNIDRPGIDQLKNVIDTAKKNPTDRRLIVNAWNPTYQSKMALPPCHIMHQILIHDGKLNLVWTQRSCDMFLGIPFNIASYAMLLLLYAKELGYKPGVLRGEFHDVHIYKNQIDQVKEQLSRDTKPLPQIEVPDENWNGMLNWTAKDHKFLTEYLCHEKIKADVAR